MSRRPLLPLLALAALLALLPACRAIKCFRCKDEPSPISRRSISSRSAGYNNTSDTGRHSVPASLQSGTVLPCSQFDSGRSAFTVQCSDSAYSCQKHIENGITTRDCSNHKPQEDTCDFSSGKTDCLCTKDYCNAAGLTTPALLLLPAALLAALYCRQ